MPHDWDPPSRRRQGPPPKARRQPIRRREARRRPTKRASTGTNHRLRILAVRFLLVAALVAAGLKLVQVQGFEAEALSAKANRQRSQTVPVPAKRGDIVDRNG